MDTDGIDENGDWFDSPQIPFGCLLVVIIIAALILLSKG